MSFHWSTFALETFNFLVLAFLLHKLLFKRVRAIVKSRQQDMDLKLSEVQLARREAEEALNKHQRALAEWSSEKDSRVGLNRKELETERKQVLSDASLEARAITDSVRAQLGNERELAARALCVETTELGIAIAQKLLRDIDHSDWLNSFFDKAYEQLKKAPGVELKDDDEVQIIGSDPIPADLGAIWQDRLRALLKRDVDVEFSTSAELIAGVEIRISNTVVRFAWSDALDQARKGINQNADAA